MAADKSIKRSASFLSVLYFARLAGEAVQSIFHFILNVSLIRTFAPYEYGSFAITFMTGVIAISFSDALFGVFATVHIPSKRWAASRVLDVTLGSVALAGCTVTSLVSAVGIWLWLGSLIASSFAGGFIGLWALRNYVRAVLLARLGTGGAIRATLSDISYAMLGAGLLGVLSFVFRIPLTLEFVFGCLCAANSVGILLCLLKQPRRPRISLRVRTFKRYGKLWREISWSLVGAATATIQGQSQMLLVAGIAGPAAFAPIAAGFVLTSPIRVFSATVANVLRPELSRMSWLGNFESIRKMMVFTGWCLFLGCFGYGICLLLAWPLLINELYSRNFAAEPMALIVGIAWLTAMTYTAYQTFRALAQAKSRFRDIALATLAGGIAGFVGVLFLLLSFGPAVSTMGVLAGEGVTLFFLWRVHVYSGVRGVICRRESKGRASLKPFQ
jgi:O-antigen/teichoic acid export membrane protein